MLDATMNTRGLRGLALLAALAGPLGCPGSEDKDGATGGPTEGTGDTDAPTSTTDAATTDVATTDFATTDVATTDVATTGDASEAACACIVDEPPGGLMPSLPTCGKTLCPILTAQSDGLNPLVIDNPEALECIVAALRDRTPGIVLWASTTEAGQFNDDGYVLIRADGTAVRRSWGDTDLGPIIGPALAGDLPGPATFEQCLTESGDAQRFHCAVDFPFGPPNVVCDEGWNEGIL